MIVPFVNAGRRGTRDGFDDEATMGDDQNFACFLVCSAKLDLDDFQEYTIQV